MITYLNKVHFYRRCRGMYWHGQYKRWDYLKVVIDILKKSDIRRVLEIGNCGLPLTSVSDTMDISKRFYRIGPTYLQSAAVTPWNIPDKQYDFTIALQVFEHLDDNRIKQVDVFSEACRVSKNIIISIPFKWKFCKFNSHENIDDDVILGWASGKKWYLEKIVGGVRKRKIYWWIL